MVCDRNALQLIVCSRGNQPLLLQTAAGSGLFTSSAAHGSDQPQPDLDENGSDMEDESADVFEWDESADTPSATDGFGSLSLRSAGTGYMGPQSGNAILRKLQSIRGSPIVEDAVVADDNHHVGVAATTLTATWFMNDCVDNYFKYYHPAYPLLHEGVFRGQILTQA